MNLQTNYLGLSLSHPVIAGASPLSATFDGIRRLEDAGAAAIVAASIYEEEIAAQTAALEAFGAVGAESTPEVSSYLPPLAGYPGALLAHLELIRRAADSISVPLIVSLNGSTREGWTGIAADVKAAGAAAVELDLFHLAVDPKQSSAEVEDRLVDTVRAVAAVAGIPVAVKLFPQFTSPAHLALKLAEAGAQGLVLFNRWQEPDIDLESLNFRSALQLSTAEDIRLPLMWIALLAGKTPLQLAGGRGVEGPDDVIKYLLAGADAVQTTTSLLRHGAEHLHILVKGLEEWLEAHDAAAVAEIRGRLRAGRLAVSEAVFRASYRQALLFGYPPSNASLRDLVRMSEGIAAPPHTHS